MTFPAGRDTAALSPGEVIAQAVDLLQSKHGVHAAAAFEMMVEGSTASQDEVRDVAAEIVQHSDEPPC